MQGKQVDFNTCPLNLLQRDSQSYQSCKQRLAHVYSSSGFMFWYWLRFQLWFSSLTLDHRLSGYGSLRYLWCPHGFRTYLWFDTLQSPSWETAKASVPAQFAVAVDARSIETPASAPQPPAPLTARGDYAGRNRDSRSALRGPRLLGQRSCSGGRVFLIPFSAIRAG